MPSTETINSTLLKTATNASKPVLYPVVIVEVEAIKCCAFIDTGAGRSYASSTLLGTIKAQPKKKEIRRVQMMFGTSTISDTKKKFQFETEVT